MLGRNLDDTDSQQTFAVGTSSVAAVASTFVQRHGGPAQAELLVEQAA